jgi:hypothetical protein
MRSLRHDLFERRLWPLVGAILAAIVVVPFVMPSHRASAEIAPPPSAQGQPGSPAPAGRASKASSHTATPTSKTRDPFQSAIVGSRAGSASSRSATAGGTSATSGRTSATSASAPASRASSGGSGGAVPGGAAASGSTPESTPPTTTPPTTTPLTTTPPASTTPVVTTPVTAPNRPSAPARTWGIYAVDIRIGSPGDPRGYGDLARLTPLPSERSPQAMYMGVTDHGRSAVFALGAAVAVRGLGAKRSAGAFCSPSRADCALIVIPAGRTVELSYVSATGSVRPLVLRVRRIALHLTHSATVARSARRHVSAVGLCDLKLGDPIGFFAPAAESVTLPAGGSCRRHTHVVPFPGSIGAGSGERG